MSAVNKPPALGSIQMLTGPQAGSTFQLSKPVTTIGRDPAQNDIVLTDASISRNHARIVNNGFEWSIENLTQGNTITVNSRSVRQETLHDRDTIGLGAAVTFLFLTGLASPKLAMPPGGAINLAPTGNLNVPVSIPPPPPQAPYLGDRQPGQGASSTGYMSIGTQRAPMGFGVPSLEISANTSPAKQISQLIKPVISIGRDPSNDIVIDAGVVSGFHAQIVREGNQLVLVHPHPARATTVNGLLYAGRHIPGNQPFRKVLTRGDIFRIGDEHGTLVTLTFNDGSGAVQEIVPEIHPIRLGTPVITIGRLQDNMVVLNNPQVSGHHARLEQVAGGGYRIIDLGSTNHVYVNAQRVTNQPLNPGDEVRIGPFKLIYTGSELTQYDESGSIRIDALRLKKVGNNATILLNDITIAVPPRKFVAVVGGSGAGKSTLMDALNGLRPAQQGTVLYNGQDYYRHLAAFSTQLGYVPQEDIVHRDLTVDRALYYAAKMRLPEDFTEPQIKQRIDEVLDDVDMTHRRHLLVSKLSGGQRKRVSIALELLAKPSVFFLDEPTSGLDPGLDRKMMFLLRKLADKGQTIVLVTHATNNINSCDYVCFLAQGGRLVYFGPPNDAKKFFNKDDFAEIYTALEPTDANPNIPAEAEARFKASPDYQKYVDELMRQGPAGGARSPQQTVAIKPPKRGDPWKQFALLSMRYIELLKNDVGNLLILLLQAPIIGLILLLIAKVVYNGETLFPNLTNLSPFDAEHMFGGSSADAERVLFVMAFAAVFFGSINGAREIVKEVAIYRRERTVNLGIVPYMMSKIVVLGVLCLLQSAIIVFMVNAVQPFNDSIFLPPILEIYITIALTSLAGLMVGLTVSAVAPNNDRAMSLIPILLLPQVIFAGTIFPLTSGPIQFLGFFFAARWAMAGLGSTVQLDKFTHLSGGDRLIDDIQTFNHNGGYLFLTWFALAAMIVLLGLTIAYFLKRKDVRV